MRGKVVHWQKDRRDYPKIFGWGFIAPDGRAETRSTRVYFNERTARYSPVKCGDVVEFELFKADSTKHQGHCAFKVEKTE